MPEYLVHKAVELSKVKTARRKELEQPGYLDLHYAASPKFDGCCAIVDTTKKSMVSRTGEQVLSCQHIIEAVCAAYPPGMVIFGEVWHADLPQSEISGMYRRHSPAVELGFVMFDAVSAEEFEAGESRDPFYDRHIWLYHTPLHSWLSHTHLPSVFPLAVAPVYNPGTYGSHTSLRDYYLCKGGYDGLILRDPEAPWIKGTGTEGAIIKSKRVLSFDLRVLAVEEGKGVLAGKAGALVLQWKDGRTIKAIGGTHAMRKLWFDRPSSIVGQIVEVEAMGYSTDGLLREPRVKTIRTDKEEADF